MAHYWIIDSSNLGICYKCGAAKQFYHKREPKTLLEGNPTRHTQLTTLMLNIIRRSIQAPVYASELAEQFHVSRERVRQINNEFSLNLPHFEGEIQVCPHCGKEFRGTTIYCSRDCAFPRVEVKKLCIQCGREFTRPTYQIRDQSPGVFCSKECQGYWLAQHYGYETPLRRVKRWRDSRTKVNQFLLIEGGSYG